MAVPRNFNDVALVLSGGLGLGAYQAGAYEALVHDGRMQVGRIAGSSVGAVNGALIAGTEADSRLQRLQEFWSTGDLWFQPATFPGYLGHAQNWLNVVHTRLFGAAVHFRPRVPNMLGPFRSLYDLTPMRDRLERLVDFGRLNSHEIRFSVAATDIESGELVIFDTSRGDEISIDHILASCGFLPEFAPVEIGGRLLGDGGLSANAPIEALSDHSRSELVFVIDLFARDGMRPRSLEDALARKNDLLFGNQTLRRLEACSEAGRIGPTVYLSYRPSGQEAGPEKTFDLSRATIAARWTAGGDDMRCALQQLPDTGPVSALTVVRRPGFYPSSLTSG